MKVNNVMFEFKTVPFEQIRARIVEKEKGIVAVKIEETPHYKYLCGNKKAYLNYLEVCCEYDKKHTLEGFKKLIDNFDIKKAGHIHCDFIEEENMYYTRDGNHRTCILFYLGFSQLKIKVENEE